MSDYTKQSNLKIIDKIEVKHQPPTFEQDKENYAGVSYVHMILDKVVKDLNNKFVPKLNNILEGNKNSLDKLETDLTAERGKIDELMEQIGNANKGLVKSLNDLSKKVKDMESKKSIGDNANKENENDWKAENFQNADTELMMMEKHIESEYLI